MIKRILKKSIFSILILFIINACIPNLSKSYLETLTTFLQLNKNSNFNLYVNITGILGSGLKIKIAQGETLSLTQNGKFKFEKSFQSGESFLVTIVQQPSSPLQICTVSGGEGIFGSGDVTTILVNCSPELFAISGTILGLEGITGISLYNNSGDSISIFSPSGTFSFATPLANGVAYNVTVNQAPNHPKQNCTITNPSGVVASANVTNISINCVTIAYPIEIVLTGLSSGSITMKNNGNEILNLTSNGTYLFPSDVNIGQNYNLTIETQPNNHICNLTPFSGTIVASKVTIDANCFSIIDQYPRNNTVLLPGQSVRFIFSSPVNAGSCVGGAGNLDLVVGSPNFVLSSTNFADDTITVTTNGSNWNTGSIRAVSLTCTNNSGKTLGEGGHNVSYTIPSIIRYVADTTGNDLNDGLTPGTPKRNIQSAITLIGACPTQDCTVLVEEGSYDPAAIGDSIVLGVSGVSLIGGYKPGTNFSERNETNHNSILLMDTPPASCTFAVLADPCKVVLIHNSITATTLVYGFKILGGDGLNTAGIHLKGAARIVNNIIQAGNAIDISIGILSEDTNTNIHYSDVKGGSCSAVSCTTTGIRINDSIGMIGNIQNNYFRGGICTNNNCLSVGWELISSGGLNANNITTNLFQGGDISTIYAGTKSYGYRSNGFFSGTLKGNSFIGGAAVQSFGFYSFSGSPINLGAPIGGNYILGGSGIESYGLRATGNGSKTIEKNTIQAGSSFSALAPSNSYAANVDGTGTVTMQFNTIIGGNSESTTGVAKSYGIFLSNSVATSKINRNRIQMATVTGATASSVNVGIYTANGGAFTISNNIIEPGTSNNSIRGLEINTHNNPLKIYYNTISSGTGSVNNTNTLFIQASSSLDIQNNIFILNDNSGLNNCIYFAGALALTSLKSNSFHNCANMLYSTTPITYTEICPGGFLSDTACANPMSGVAASANTNIDPKLQNPLTAPYNFNFTENSPCLISQSPNLLAGLIFDIPGNSRPGSNATVSMGAYEYDGTCL